MFFFYSNARIDEKQAPLSKLTGNTSYSYLHELDSANSIEMKELAGCNSKAQTLVRPSGPPFVDFLMNKKMTKHKTLQNVHNLNRCQILAIMFSREGSRFSTGYLYWYFWSLEGRFQLLPPTLYIWKRPSRLKRKFIVQTMVIYQN